MWQNLFHPQYLKWRWAFCVSIGIYLYLFVTFCEPFKDDKITYIWASTNAYLQHNLLNFTMTVLSCAIPLIFIPYYFPSYFLAQKVFLRRFSFWTVLTALLIESAYFLGNHLFFHHDLSLGWFVPFMLKVTFTSFLFMGVPFLFLFILLFNHFINPQSPTHNTFSASSELDNSVDITSEPTTEVDIPQSLSTQNTEENQPIILYFSDVSNKKQIEVPLDRLYYITSVQNYIEVFYKNAEGTFTSQLLRNTLKTIEEEWATYADLPLVRCHKAFIVNLDKVLALQGTSKNAQFIFKEIDIKIPVSRHKFADFEEKRTLQSTSI